MVPTSDVLGPQNGPNATCSQSSSKRKFYENFPEMLLYLILNKVYVRCFCVLTSTKSGLRFDVNLEMDKKCSWRPQEADKPDGDILGRCWAPSRNQEGPNIDPKSVQNDRNRAPSLTESSVFSSCFSCGCNKPTFFGVNFMLIWGRC